MRRESSTVIALVGHLSGDLLAALSESGNVSVARAPGAGPSDSVEPASPARSAGPAPAAMADGPGSAMPTAARASTRPPRRSAPQAGQPGRVAGTGAAEPTTPSLAWQPGALAMRAAARRRATYVVVAGDPLAGVASAWRAMWDVTSGPVAAAAFERQAAETLAAWRDKLFELPDYYLVVVPAQDVATGPDLYLGPLRAARPHRVAVTGTADRTTDGAWRTGTASVLAALRSLQHGPWWPPLDDLLDAARRFYAGGLAETQQARYS